MAIGSLPGEERDLVEAVSPEQLMASTRAIAQWVRLSGTTDEARAFDWIEGRLRETGLETARYAHPGLVSWPESAALTLTSDGAQQSVPCDTHGFAASTPAGGFEGDVVYVGRGSEEELRKAGVRGKIVLVDGIVAPNRNLIVEAAGAAGSIWIAGIRLHERILSPVWGTPTPETGGLLPRTPSGSITADEGARVKALLARGPVRARLETRVYRGWKSLPCLTGDLRPAGDSPDAETFVMLSRFLVLWRDGQWHGERDDAGGRAPPRRPARRASSGIAPGLLVGPLACSVRRVGLVCRRLLAGAL